MKRAPKVLLFVLINTVLLLAILTIALEPALRILKPTGRVSKQHEAFFPGDPDLRYAIRPSAETVMTREDFRITVRSNALGFRDVDRDPKGDAVRILTVGDSFTFGWGVEGEDTFQARMERLQGAGGRSRLEVINAGVPGYNLYQSILALEKKGWKVDPDIVIFGVFVQNDFLDNLSTAAWLERKRSGKIGESDESALAAWLESHSMAYVFLRKMYMSSYRLRRAWYKVTRIFKPDEERQRFKNLLVFRRDVTEEAEEEWRLAEKLLLKFRDDVRSRGRQPLVVLFPAEVQADRAQMEKDIRNLGMETASFDAELPNKRLRAFCREHDIPFLDPLPAYRAAAEAGQQLYFPRDHHWNAQGHALAARLILADLRARGWLTDGAGSFAEQ